MFWRAARGRVGPNSRAGLHMAIFLLNPYGLYARILIPKWLASLPKMARFASSPEMSRFASYLSRSVRCPRRGRICQSVLDFQSVYLTKNVARRLQDIIWPSTPHFLTLASLAPNPEHYMPIGSHCACIKRRNECGHLTYIKKYDIIFKKRYACAGGGSAI